MYCGKNRTALTSQRQIAAALLSLMSEKPYADIPVSELCKSAGVSRQTFYSLFSSKDNVITYALQEHYTYAPAEGLSCASLCLRGLCHAFSLYLTEQQSFMKALVDNDITSLLYDSLLSSLSGCGCFLDQVPEVPRDYAADFIAGGFTSIARTYVRRGLVDDAAFLEELACTLLRGCLYHA